MTLTDALALLRPRHWIKNTFVLLPLIAAGRFLDPAAVLAALLATVAFCLAASLVYVFNDIHDAEHDRLHPLKLARRPVAAGRVSPRAAWWLAAALAAALGLALLPAARIWPAVAAYLAVNALYTLRLKHEPVLDIFTIASGFVLRLYGGSLAIGVALSPWMLTTGFCLSLYLAAIKRRQELVLQNGSETRRVLERYSVALIDRYAEMAATGTIIFYSLFVMATRPELVITIPLVLYGLFRYWYIVEIHQGGESPTDALLGDWPLLGSVGTWTAIYAWTILPGVH